jgi:hypothetical protein
LRCGARLDHLLAGFDLHTITDAQII